MPEEDSLNRFLLNETDILFAMGTSALEGAKLGVPTVLLISHIRKCLMDINTGGYTNAMVALWEREHKIAYQLLLVWHHCSLY